MPPHRVVSIEGYVEWLEIVIERHGGWSVDQLTAETDKTHTGRALTHALTDEILGFPDGARLSFDLLLSGDLKNLHYNYRYWLDDRQVLRLDKHPSRHEAADGGQTHLHVMTVYPERREPTPEMDFDEAVDYLRGRDPRW